MSSVSRQHVEIALERHAEDELRAEDGPAPVFPVLPVAQIVFLQPVKIFVRVPRSALVSQNRERLNMDAVRLSPLQHRNVLKPAGRASPVSHRAFRTAQRTLDGRRRVFVRRFCAACPVVQIDRYEGGAVQVIRDAVGDAHHVLVGQAGEMPHRGEAYQAGKHG